MATRSLSSTILDLQRSPLGQLPMHVIPLAAGLGRPMSIRYWMSDRFTPCLMLIFVNRFSMMSHGSIIVAYCGLSKMMLAV